MIRNIRWPPHEHVDMARQLTRGGAFRATPSAAPVAQAKEIRPDPVSWVKPEGAVHCRRSDVMVPVPSK
ncbi:hypothetical protein GCM10012278_35120 [Nonomuraea glycinis]|uniref:Uncharacterized protein n=1 Tax=Nonomuraea glycinis TaxID=2047744 RepID=A0A918E628_9ACTN|nr:hypothetical protein GCM10012278_35120 [Nonomuraea glycinis]